MTAYKIKYHLYDSNGFSPEHAKMHHMQMYVCMSLSNFRNTFSLVMRSIITAADIYSSHNTFQVSELLIFDQTPCGKSEVI